MFLIFSRDTGVTQDNVPDQFLGIAKSIGVTNGDFKILTDYPIDEIRRMLLDAGYDNIFSSTGYCLVNQSTNRNAQQNDQQPAQEGGSSLGNFQVAPPANMQAETYAHQAAVHAPVTTEETCEYDEEELEQEEITDADDYDEEDPIYYPPTIDLHEFNEEELMSRLTFFVNPEEASAISLYNSKVAEYNRVWGSAINLKRRLDQMMGTIEKNEVLKNIKSDVEYLNEKCDLIDSVKFYSSFSLVITTKDLVTTSQPLFGSRLLGRMRFIIDLRYLYAPTPPSTNFVNSIDIINLDRNPLSATTRWACGHVHHNEGGTNICFGGYYQQIFDAMTSRNLAQLVDILMRFVLNPDERDEWGSRIKMFPLATPTEES